MVNLSKQHNWLLLAVIGMTLMVEGSAFANSEEQSTGIPIPLANGDKAYKEEGPAGFFMALLDNAVPDDAVSKTALYEQAAAVTEALRQAEGVYGGYKGIELIESIPIAESARVVYYMLKYESGPVYGALTVYKTDEGEIVTGFAVNTELHRVVPPDLVINRAQTSHLHD